MVYYTNPIYTNAAVQTAQAAPVLDPYPVLFFGAVLLIIIAYMIYKGSRLLDKLTGQPPPDQLQLPPPKKSAV